MKNFLFIFSLECYIISICITGSNLSSANIDQSKNVKSSKNNLTKEFRVFKIFKNKKFRNVKTATIKDLASLVSNTLSNNFFIKSLFKNSKFKASNERILEKDLNSLNSVTDSYDYNVTENLTAGATVYFNHTTQTYNYNETFSRFENYTSLPIRYTQETSIFYPMSTNETELKNQNETETSTFGSEITTAGMINSTQIVTTQKSVDKELNRINFPLVIKVLYSIFSNLFKSNPFQSLIQNENNFVSTNHAQTKYSIYTNEMVNSTEPKIDNFSNFQTTIKDVESNDSIKLTSINTNQTMIITTQSTIIQTSQAMLNFSVSNEDTNLTTEINHIFKNKPVLKNIYESESFEKYLESLEAKTTTSEIPLNHSYSSLNETLYSTSPRSTSRSYLKKNKAVNQTDLSKLYIKSKGQDNHEVIERVNTSIMNSLIDIFGLNKNQRWQTSDSPLNSSKSNELSSSFSQSITKNEHNKVEIEQTTIKQKLQSNEKLKLSTELVNLKKASVSLENINTKNTESTETTNNDMKKKNSNHLTSQKAENFWEISTQSKANTFKSSTKTTLKTKSLKKYNNNPFLKMHNFFKINSREINSKNSSKIKPMSKTTTVNKFKTKKRVSFKNHFNMLIRPISSNDELTTLSLKSQFKIGLANNKNSSITLQQYSTKKKPVAFLHDSRKSNNKTNSKSKAKSKILIKEDEVNGSFKIKEREKYAKIIFDEHNTSCVFPFIYMNKTYNKCINVGRNESWCSLTKNYDRDFLWKFCEKKTIKTIGGNSNGSACSFPFLYKGKIQNSCINRKYKSDDGAISYSKFCSTTPNYDKDEKWGYCLDQSECHFPFVFNGIVYTSCISSYLSPSFCATSYNFHKDRSWSHCDHVCPAFPEKSPNLLNFQYLNLNQSCRVKEHVHKMNGLKIRDYVVPPCSVTYTCEKGYKKLFNEPIQCRIDGTYDRKAFCISEKLFNDIYS